jgi:hypothetical protein
MKAIWREIGKDREKTQLAHLRPNLYMRSSAVMNPVTSENNVTMIRRVRKLKDVFVGCGLCRHISNATQTAPLTNAAMKVPIAPLMNAAMPCVQLTHGSKDGSA